MFSMLMMEVQVQVLSWGRRPTLRDLYYAEEVKEKKETFERGKEGCNK